MDNDPKTRKRIPLEERNLPAETIAKLKAMISKKVLEDLIEEGKIKPKPGGKRDL